MKVYTKLLYSHLMLQKYLDGLETSQCKSGFVKHNMCFRLLKLFYVNRNKVIKQTFS
jgi:hypothetical protein